MWLLSILLGACLSVQAVRLGADLSQGQLLNDYAQDLKPASRLQTDCLSEKFQDSENLLEHEQKCPTAEK